MESVECVVVGAGVVGLAVARALAMSGREVFLIDAAEGIGTETSSRNSEVIHAGIYYPAGSLMARLCVAGKWAMYAYCNERGIAHRNCGKLIVATSDEEARALPGIAARAAANSVPDLRLLPAEEARALEPALVCTQALLSPSTGILDSHAFMVSLQGDAEEAGALCVFRSPVLGGSADRDGITIEVGGEESSSLCCKMLVNAAGLHAPALAASITGMPRRARPDARCYAKGNYFTLDRPRAVLPARSIRCRCRAASASI